MEKLFYPGIGNRSGCGNRGGKNQDLATIARHLVSRDSRRIPEAGMLLQVLAQDDADRSRHILVKGASMIWVVSDPVFDSHLEGIFHMENRKRTRALASILAKEPFPDRIIPVQPRAAAPRAIMPNPTGPWGSACSTTWR